MSTIAASFIAAKRRFRDDLLDLVGINFCICEISIDPGHRQRCFWSRQRAVWAISGSRHQPRTRRRSVSCDRVNINKPKLQNFDRPFGLPGHLVGNVSSLWNTMVRVRGSCLYHQPRNNSRDRTDVNRRKCRRYTRYLWNFDEPLGLSGRRRQCFWHRQRVISSKNDGASPW